MTKADTIQRIVEKTGIQKEDVEKTLESLFVTIKDSMSERTKTFISEALEVLQTKKEQQRRPAISQKIQP